MQYQNAANDFITHLKTRNYADSTISDIKQNLRCFCKYLTEKNISDILQITRNDILEYMKEIKKREVSEETKAGRPRVVRQLFTFLQEDRRLLINPLEGITLPAKRRSLFRIILTTNEMKRLIEAPNTGLLDGIRDRALLELLYSAGLRVGEVVKLDTEDINLKNACLMVREGKGEKDRLIPIGSTAICWLREYIKKVRPHFDKTRHREPALFISMNGERFTPYWVTTTLKEYAYQAKIKKEVTTHIIRHSMASHLLLGGAPVEIIQQILGHKDMQTTTKYTRVFPVDVKKTHEKTHPGEKCT